MADTDSPRTSRRLTPKQRAVIALIRERGVTYVDDPNFHVPITGEATQHDAYTVWLNYRTAAAFERRGIGFVQGVGEECEFVLRPEWEWPS